MKITITALLAIMITGCVGEATPQMRNSKMDTSTLNNNKVKVFSFWNSEVSYNYYRKGMK